MRKKAIKKDFMMEVKNSLNRYISILLIVALGVAFFSGIRASESDMQISADRYYDDTALMDIRVISTMGLTDNDLSAIERIDGVRRAEPVKSLDVLSTTTDAEYVFQLFSRTDSINKIKVIEGRLPKDDNECLVDSLFVSKSGYKIGDTLTFRSGNDTEIKENLAGTKYTIVGIGDSPKYLSYKRGNSSIGNGSVDFFAVLPPQVFLSDIYSEIYVSVENTISLNSYSKEYENRVEKVVNRIEAVSDIQAEIRYEDVLSEPKKELEDAKTELAKAKEKADKEFLKGEKELKDAEEKITSGEAALKEGWEKLSDGKEELDKNQKKLSEYKEELAKGRKELEKARGDIKIWDETLISKRNEYKEGEKAYNEGFAAWKKSYKEYKNGLTELKTKETELKQNIEKIQSQKTSLEPVKDLYPDEWEQLLQNETLLNAGLLEINSQKVSLDTAGKQLDAAKLELDKKKITLTQADTTLSAEEKKLKAAKTELTAKEGELTTGQEQLVKMQQELSKGAEELNKNEVTLKEKEAELQTGKKDLEEGKKTFAKEKEKAEKEIGDAQDKIAKGEKDLSEIELPKWYVLDRNSIQTYVEYGQDAERIGNIGKVFPVIFFLVAALVSLTTMTRMVEEQRTQIGTLKALGYGKKSIAGKYIWYALSASLLGSILGVLIGEQILPKVIIVAYKIMYYTLPEAITPYNYYYGVLSALAATACTTLAAFFSCYKELAAKPAKLMRPVAPKIGKRVILEYLPFIWGRLNFTSKAAVRNLLRYKKRFFMTVFGIGSCTALLLVGFGIKDSVGAISDIQYVDLWKQDGVLSLDEDMNKEEKDALLKELVSNNLITNTMLVKGNTLDAGYDKTAKSISLIVPEDNAKISDYVVFRDRKTKNAYKLDDGGVIITEKLASLLKVEAGDTIYLEDGNKDRVEVYVTAVTENYMFHYIFMSSALYENLYKMEPAYNAVYLKGDITKASEGAFAEEMLKNSNITNVTFTTEYQKQIADMLSSLNMVIYVLIVSAGLLAFIVMYNLNNININERKRELATLKVLGFMDGEVGTYVYRENIMLTVIGTVFGLLLGIVLHYYVIITAELDLIMFGRNIKAASFLFSMLLTFVFAAFVNFVMYFKLQKINMVESLKSVE